MEKLERAARERTSGAHEFRGTAGIVGHYLLALVLEENGDTAAAATERQKAAEMSPLAARLALLEAQLDTARAHQ